MKRLFFILVLLLNFSLSWASQYIVIVANMNGTTINRFAPKDGEFGWGVPFNQTKPPRSMNMMPHSYNVFWVLDKKGLIHYYQNAMIIIDQISPSECFVEEK